jgi:glyoxylase I family protein
VPERCRLPNRARSASRPDHPCPDRDGIFCAALTVTDLDRSDEWYTRVLGMVKAFREEATDRRATVYRFAGGATSVGLVEHRGPGAAFDPAVVGLDHLAFSVASQAAMRDWAAHLNSQNVQHSGPIEVPPGEILNFKTPTGSPSRCSGTRLPSCSAGAPDRRPMWPEFPLAYFDAL